MTNYTVKTYNNIAKIGLNELGQNFTISADLTDPDAIILRSQDLHTLEINDTLLAVARAGAGVNNIPVQEMAAKGVVVFNTPGANANAVKEAVIAGLLISARNIVQAANYSKQLKDEDIKTQVENGKKQFAGNELTGKTLGVIGLGAIGYKVANTAVALGMKVQGYDPMLSQSVRAQLNPEVRIVEDILTLAAEADYLTVHVPLFDATKGMINRQILNVMPQGSVLLNFSRDLVVDEQSVLELLDAKKLKYYVTDFPNNVTKDHSQVIGLPHLGASTAEAEDTCAVMAGSQLKQYLETGNIENSVNFPNIDAGTKPNQATRIVVLHKNIPGVVAKISNNISQNGINIHDLFNKSKGDFACTILDVDVESSDSKIVTLQEQLAEIDDLLKVRTL